VTQDIHSGPGDLAPGEQLAGYEIQQRIGHGGMAVVYRALDLRLGRLVALKVLAPHLGEDEAFRQRFMRESRAAAGVDHPHIIPVFEAGEAAGMLFIAMRYVGHGDVRRLIESEGRLSPARTARITAQVASALDAAHAHGLVHRDVKPANILLGQASGSDADHCYLSDFGLSKHSLTVSTLTSTGQFLGTLDYVSPEQIQGQPVDGRADQYALACAVVEMLTGQPPFRRDDSMALMWAQLEAEPPRLTERRPDLPPAVDEVIAAALSKSPDGRFGTCREFASALAAACEEDRPRRGLGTAPAEPVAADAFFPGDQFATDPFAAGGRPVDPFGGEARPADPYGAEARPGDPYELEARPSDPFAGGHRGADAGPRRQADPFAGGHYGADAGPRRQADPFGASHHEADASPRRQADPFGASHHEADASPHRQADPYGASHHEADASPHRQADPYGASHHAADASPHRSADPWSEAPREWFRGHDSDPAAAEETVGPGWRGNGGGADGPVPVSMAPFRPAVDAAWPPGASPTMHDGATPATKPRPPARTPTGHGQPGHHRGRNIALALLIIVVGVCGVAGIAYKLSHRNDRSLPPVTVYRTVRPTAQDPARTVREYFAAINRHRYLAAWRLSDESESFAAFKAGFAGTAYDTVTILSTSGDVVSARLVATQANGTVKTYQGTYEVTGGVITATDVRRVS
jgi:Protein kinase domain